MTTPGMRVLIVSPVVPSTSWGFGTRVFHLAQHLAKRHSVTLLGYGADADQKYAEALRQCCNVRLIPRQEAGRAAKRRAQLASLASMMPFGCQDLHTPAMQQAIDELAAAERFDVVQVESSQVCTFRFPRGAAVILDEHNIEYELLRRMGESERTAYRRLYNRVEQARFRRFEHGCWRRVDGCAVTSEREAQIIRRHAPATPTATVPNAVDVSFFRPADERPDSDSMVFTGLLTYRPNLDAAKFLVDEIMPLVRRDRPRATLTIVGQGAPGDLDQLRGPGVTVTGWVKDIRPFVARAAVVAVPLRIGGGTRLKVVEALAMAKPVVSTTLGCEGLNVRDREHVSIGDGPGGFAARCVEMLAQPATAQAVGKAGRALIVNEYSWDRAGDRLEELFATVVSGATVGSGATVVRGVAATKGADPDGA